jgi:glutathione S-transferase
MVTYYTKVTIAANLFSPPDKTRRTTVKLYYSPGACSLSPHIVARELGLDIALQKVDTGTKTIKVEGDYFAVNPKGYVPALQLEDGEVLTEGPAIVQFLGDQKPGSGLVPKAGTMERYRLQEMLGYINSEIHKSYSPLFNPKTPAETVEDRKQYLAKRYKFLDERLAGREYLFGDRFTAADAYLFTVTNWAKHVKLDLSGFKNLVAFQKRVAERPAVKEAMKVEGLIH